MQNYAFNLNNLNQALFSKMASDLVLIEHDENQLLLIIKEFLKKKELDFKIINDVGDKIINEKFWKIYSDELEILKKKYTRKFLHKNHGNFLSTISVEFIKKNRYLIQ